MAITQAAINFAKKNPNDPRSAEILRRAQTSPTETPGVKGVGVGIAKRGLSTAINVTKGLQAVGQGALAAITPGKSLSDIRRTTGIKSLSDKSVAQTLTPRGTAEKTGTVLADLAMFLAPSSAITKTEQALGIGGKTIKAALGRGAVEAVTAGATVTAQKGQFDDDAKTAAIISALLPVAATTVSKARTAIGSYGEKKARDITYSIIKPTLSDVKSGFKVENVQKHGIKGNNAAELLEDTTRKLKTYAARLNSNLGKTKATIDIERAIRETELELLGSRGAKAKSFPIGSGVEREIANLRNELSGVWDDITKTPAGLAQMVKQGAGTKGAWSYGFPDKDAVASEKVYNAFYKAMKKQFDAIPGIQFTNRTISELIPIQSALIRRIPVEARQSALGLKDSMAIYASLFDPKALAVLGVDKLSKSQGFARLLAKAASKVKPGQAGTLVKRFTGI